LHPPKRHGALAQLVEQWTENPCKTTTLLLWFFCLLSKMHFLYVLYSKAANRYYVGETSDVDTRLKQHNQHHFKKGFTKAAEDWKVVLSKKCSSKEEAVYLEKFIKRMKSRKFIQKVVLNPKILDDLLNKK